MYCQASFLEKFYSLNFEFNVCCKVSRFIVKMSLSCFQVKPDQCLDIFYLLKRNDV